MKGKMGYYVKFGSTERKTWTAGRSHRIKITNSMILITN